jgi:hypothetical protein
MSDKSGRHLNTRERQALNIARDLARDMRDWMAGHRPEPAPPIPDTRIYSPRLPIGVAARPDPAGRQETNLMTQTQPQIFSYTFEQSTSGETYVAVREDGNGPSVRIEHSPRPVHDFGKEKMRAAVAEYRRPGEIPPFLRVVVWKGRNEHAAREADFVIERHTIKPKRGQ